LFARMKRDGVVAGDRKLTADYLGGLFSLNGVYPGAACHGVIANEMLRVLNEAFGTSYLPIDIADLAAHDPVAGYRTAPGPVLTLGRAAAFPPAPAPAAAPPRAHAASVETVEHERRRIKLPANLELTIPINSEASYFGDALRAAHATI